MTIRFACPNCEATIGAADDMLSQRIECPRCVTSLFVPDPTAADVFDVTESENLVAEEAPVNFGSGRQRSEPEMDMTPMVDVTFLLLIFFMVTAAFSLQKSFQIPTPKEDRPSSTVMTLEDFEEDEDYVIVRIDENSTFYISAAQWDDEREAPSKQDLLVALRDARSVSDPKPTRLLVMAHADSWHERVVMAMDAGTAVGMNDVKLVTVEDDT